MKVLLFAPAILICLMGIVTDITQGRVRNVHLMISIILWVVVLALNYATDKSIYLTISWAINVCLAVIASLIFYLTDIWAPGDSKMFITIAITYPMFGYVAAIGNIFPALNFVIGSFGLGYIFLIIQMIFSRNKIYENKKRVEFSKRRMISIIANIGLITAMNSLIYMYVPQFYDSNEMLCLLTIIGITCLIQQKAERVRMILGIVGLIFYLIGSINKSSFQEMIYGIGVSLIISLILDIMNRKAMTNTYRKVSSDEIKPGMILSYTSILAMQRCIDTNIPRTTTENRRSRMTISQAEAVRTWCINAKSDVVIVEMIPFAPFIALSVIIETIRYFVR